jgi:hypothetical protein
VQRGTLAGVQKELNRVARNQLRDEKLSRPPLNSLTAENHLYFWRPELAALNEKVAE